MLPKPNSSLLRVRPDLQARPGGYQPRQGLPVPPTLFEAADKRIVLLARPLSNVVPNTLRQQIEIFKRGVKVER